MKQVSIPANEGFRTSGHEGHEGHVMPPALKPPAAKPAKVKPAAPPTSPGVNPQEKDGGGLPANATKRMR